MKSLGVIRPADYAWAGIAAIAIVYELCADDLLSDSTARSCQRHPILTRLTIGALAGHLACLLPASVDLFNASNIIHRALIAHYPYARDRKAI